MSKTSSTPGDQTVTPEGYDPLFSLRASRYEQGLCISCGEEAAVYRLHTHPAMLDARTHCLVCAKVEWAHRERSHKPGRYGAVFHEMLVPYPRERRSA